MQRPRRLRSFRVVLVVLATLVSVPSSFVVRALFFPPTLDVTTIRREPSYQDPALLDRAWRLPVATTYRQGLLYQSNGSVCGPTSVANVERSLGRAGSDVATVLRGTGKCWTGVCWGGLTLDELAEVARHATGRQVTLLRDLTLKQFREELRHVNDPSRRYIANFQRRRSSPRVAGTTRPWPATSKPRTWSSCSMSTRPSNPGWLRPNAYFEPSTPPTPGASADCYASSNDPLGWPPLPIRCYCLESPQGPLAESAYAGDLKSSDRKVVPVRVREGLPRSLAAPGAPPAPR